MLFMGSLVRLDTSEERISELKNMSIETSKMEKQEEKHWGEGENGIPKNCGTTTKGVTFVRV